VLEVKAGQPAPRRLGRLPVEAARFNSEAAFLGKVENIAYAQDRILKMGRYYREVVCIESDEFQEIHEPINLLLSFEI
jgi:hypothetical protein